jgi:hypothetical protein
MNFMINQLIAGAIILGSWSVALFFLRFFKRTGDRLFGCFALAFFLIGVERIVMASLDAGSEFRAYVYVIRLVAFLVIIAGIFDKNRSGKKQT